MPVSAVRSASASDIPTLVELMEEFHAESGFPLNRTHAAETFSLLLSNSAWGAAWVLERAREPAGFVVLTLRFSMEHGGLQGIVDDLFVRVQHRRQGLARTAMEALFAECAGRGIRDVQVEVSEDNAAARALYRDFGLRDRTGDRQVMVGRVPPPPG